MDKSLLVKKVFSSVSIKYDFMNDIMSMGMHRFWKNNLVDLMIINNNDQILDLAGGSGDISKRILKKNSNTKVILYDRSKEMIAIAKKKIKNKQVKFICDIAERMPFDNKSFDIIVTSFGLRNFSDIQKSMVEIHRTLKQGGKFYCLEFSKVNSKSLRFLFNAYCKLIPKLGNFFANDQEAYEYLIESIKCFPNQIEISKKLRNVGFKNIECFDLLDGVASIHIGVK